MDEKVKDSLIFAAAVIFILSLLFISCGLVALLFLVPEEGTPTVPEEPSVPESPPEGPVPEEPPATVSPEDLERWERITLENVEDGCLRVARDEAGSSASLVYGCACEETATAERKSYSCDISTADPFTSYFANIDCFLADAACSIETNYGVVTLTFQEMDEWYG